MPHADALLTSALRQGESPSPTHRHLLHSLAVGQAPRTSFTSTGFLIQNGQAQGLHPSGRCRQSTCRHLQPAGSSTGQPTLEHLKHLNPAEPLTGGHPESRCLFPRAGLSPPAVPWQGLEGLAFARSLEEDACWNRASLVVPPGPSANSTESGKVLQEENQGGLI